MWQTIYRKIEYSVLPQLRLGAAADERVLLLLCGRCFLFLVKRQRSHLGGCVDVRNRTAGA